MIQCILCQNITVTFTLQFVTYYLNLIKQETYCCTRWMFKGLLRYEMKQSLKIGLALKKDIRKVMYRMHTVLSVMH